MDALTWTLARVTGPDAAVDALLARHHADMTAQSPAESCHVMTGADLRGTGAALYALRGADGAVAGIGALKPMGRGAVELKSMHIARDLRGRGAGRELLSHLLDAARATGAASAWLETGTAPTFDAARALYLGHGFAVCPPFGAYRPDPLSVFMTRAL
jgi:putative acetyltransferase